MTRAAKPALIERLQAQRERHLRRPKTVRAAATTTERVLTGVAALLASAAVVAWAVSGDVPLLPV
jgi:hypothetical protein